MCTYSLIPLSLGRGYRVVVNRDESRRRPAATPPRWHDLPGPVRAIWPVDPKGGGTWVAASTAGLTLALLNHNPPDAAAPPNAISRGTIIPAVAHLPTSDAVLAALSRMPLGHFAPFRLVTVEGLADGTRVTKATWDRRRLTTAEHAGRSMCFVSSGLGDDLVQPRIALFAERVAAGPQPTAEDQDAFHRHVWPDRPEISVLMSRASARTVSITTVEMVGEGGVWRPTMTYHPVPETPLPPVRIAVEHPPRDRAVARPG